MSIIVASADISAGAADIARAIFSCADSSSPAVAGMMCNVQIVANAANVTAIRDLFEFAIRIPPFIDGARRARQSRCSNHPPLLHTGHRTHPGVGQHRVLGQLHHLR